jgi:hypothetical protein
MDAGTGQGTTDGFLTVVREGISSESGKAYLVYLIQRRPIVGQNLILIFESLS